MQRTECLQAGLSEEQNQTWGGNLETNSHWTFIINSQSDTNTLLFTFPKQPIPTRVCSNFAVSQAENWSQHKSCWAAAFSCTTYSKLRWNYDAFSATLTLICCHILLALDSDACCAPLTLIYRLPLLLALADEWSQRKEFFYATSAKSYKECMKCRIWYMHMKLVKNMSVAICTWDRKTN
jgi:hypothetical protein